MSSEAEKRPTHCLCGCGGTLPLKGRRPKRFLRGHGATYRASLKPVPCACGCGKTLIPLKQKGFQTRRYIQRHTPRGEAHGNYSSGPKMKDKATVGCRTCERSWLKRRDTLSSWGGQCRSCAYSDPNKEIVAQKERARKEMYSLIHGTLKRLKKKKLRKAADLVGYTAQDLYDHITHHFKQGMSWEKRHEWHIDHITPVSQFIQEGIYDPKIINALTNLQPLWVDENLSKGGVRAKAGLRSYAASP